MQFGIEWSDNFSKNLEEANRNLSYYRAQLKNTAEAYGTYSAFLGLQNMEKTLTDGYNRMLQERAEAEKAAAEQSEMLAVAQKRFATNSVTTAQKNLNAVIDEYNAKVAESNRLLEEKRRIEDLDSYEDEPWFNDYEFPVNKIMETSQQFAAAEDAANLFKIALKEAVRVYRELGGDMKLPFSDEGLLKEIDIPVKVTPVLEKPKSSKIKVREFASQEEYDIHNDQYRDAHDGETEYLENVIDIVPRLGQGFSRIAADMMTSCKKAETAVKRFFSAINPEKYPELAEWESFVKEGMDNGVFNQSDTEAGWSWEVQALDDNTYYVSLVAIAEGQSKVVEKAGEIKDKIIGVADAIKKLNDLSQDPWNIKTEEEVNNILKERLDIIEKIGEEKLKAYDAEEFEGIKNVNEYYSDRLDGFKELRDDNIYRQLDEQYGYLNERIESSKELENLLKNMKDIKILKKKISLFKTVLL